MSPWPIWNYDVTKRPCSVKRCSQSGWQEAYVAVAEAASVPFCFPMGALALRPLGTTGICIPKRAVANCHMVVSYNSWVNKNYGIIVLYTAVLRRLTCEPVTSQYSEEHHRVFKIRLWWNCDACHVRAQLNTYSMENHDDELEVPDRISKIIAVSCRLCWN